MKQIVCIKPLNIHRQYDKSIFALGEPSSDHLEVGKVYTVVFESDYFYYINNSIGGQNSYIKDSFVTLEEWRESRLGKIGI